MFDELMVGKAIDVPEAKCPNKIGRINDPNYYKYHRLIGHPMEKYFVFKNKSMQ
jgi:hypothetical protein